MQERPLLRISILCETLLDAEVSKKLFEYFNPYDLAIRLNIDGIHLARKVICIPSTLCDPIFNTEFSFIIRTQDQLYGILVNLVCLALNHLNKTGYHPTGDALTIFIPSTPNDDLSYTFGWRLHY